MSLRSKTALAALAAAGVLALAACSSSSSASSSTSGSASSSTSASGGNSSHAGWPTTITIGSIPAENATQLAASLKPIGDLITKKLGVQVKTFAGTSYAALIEAQKAGKVDLVEYGPLSDYIAQHTGAGIENVGIMIFSPRTTGGYYSIGWANSSMTNVHSLKDFKGLKTCFVDPASTSGFLYPSYGLETAGINPTTGVQPVFAGAHDASVEAIAKGTCQVGFSENSMAPTLEQEGKIKASQIRQVWQSPEIPGNPIAASTSLPASFRAALENVLVQDANVPALVKEGICSNATSCGNTLGLWGFAPPSVANFSAIAQVCAETKSTSCTKA